MEAWRQRPLGGKKKKLVEPSQRRIDLTPTGLLMEGHYTSEPEEKRFYSQLKSDMAIFQQPSSAEAVLDLSRLR